MGDDAEVDGDGPRLAVVAPSLIVTITVERSPDGADEIHLHAGGQGFWVARMASALGARVRLCTVLGGEGGQALRGLLADEDIVLDAVAAPLDTPAYIDDRREGKRVRFATSPVQPLGRHEVDELFAMAIGAGIDADAVLLGGPQSDSQVPHDFHRRLASDLRSNGTFVAADLSGEALRSALAGGLDLLKVADEELVESGFAEGSSQDELLRGIDRLREAGADNVLVTRAEEPSLARAEDRTYELSYPRFEALEPRGAGDSTFAAVVTVLAGDAGWEEALRTGIAAGSLNVTRRGLGTGHRADVAALAEHVEVRRI
jgi:1-phosphofructokinase